LFDKIESLTYPEVGEFLRNHVGGSESLPLVRVLDWVGIIYEPFHSVKIMSMGGISIGLNDNQELFVADDFNLNAFGKAMGYQKGDVLKSLNGQELKLVNAGEIFDDYLQNFPVGDTVKMVVRRKVDGKKIRFQMKQLKSSCLLGMLG